MIDIEYRWERYMASRTDARTPNAYEDLERSLLGGSLFDPEDPYIVDLARQVLDEVDPSDDIELER